MYSLPNKKLGNPGNWEKILNLNENMNEVANPVANQENIQPTQAANYEEKIKTLSRSLRVSSLARRVAEAKVIQLQKEIDVLKKDNAHLLKQRTKDEAMRLRETEKQQEEATLKEQEMRQAKAEQKRVNKAKRLKATHNTFVKTCENNAKEVGSYVSQGANALRANSPEKAATLVNAYVTLHSCPANDDYTGYFQNIVSAYQQYFPLLLEGLRFMLIELCNDVTSLDATTLTSTLNDAFSEENNDATISLTKTTEIVDAIVKLSDNVGTISGKYHHTTTPPHHHTTTPTTPPHHHTTTIPPHHHTTTPVHHC